METMIGRCFKIHKKAITLVYCVSGIMVTLLIYGVMQERIMRVPYGEKKEFFQYSLFIVFCNRALTGMITIIVMLIEKKEIAPVAPLYKYGAVSLSNMLSTTCQYEALKYVTFPIQTLAKSAKMIPVMIWGMMILQKRYKARDYIIAVSVTAGCAVFFLYGDDQRSTMHSQSQSSLLGTLLMVGYLGFDGFTSTFQDKLFKGYDMDIVNQILYVTLFSCGLSLIGLLSRGQLLLAVSFVSRNAECLFHISVLSLAATVSQFFISYTIRTFGSLVFAIIMTTRQLISISLSCLWFGHPLSLMQWAGASLVFGSLYYKSYAAYEQKSSGTLDRV